MSSGWLCWTAYMFPTPLRRCRRRSKTRLARRVCSAHFWDDVRSAKNACLSLKVAQHLFCACLFESGSVDVEALNNAVLDQHGKALAAHAHSALAQI